MSANWNNLITANLLSAATAVRRQDFGLVCLATTGATFASGVHKIYEGNTEAQADDELDAATKLAAAAFFSQEPSPQKLMIAEATYESVGGELGTALDAALAAHEFYGLCIGSRADADLEAADTWALANKKLAFLQTSSADMLTATTPNIGDTLKTAGSGRSVLLYRGDDTEWLDMALISAFLVASPDQFSTTLAHQTAKGYGADTVDSTEKSSATGYYCNLYLDFYGGPAVNKGWLTDGKRADTILAKDWYSARAQEAVAQLLKDKASLKTKVDFTNPGMVELAKEVKGVQARGERIGHFKEDKSTILIPDVSEIAGADIQDRKATMPATVYLTGAVESATLNLAVLETE